MTNYSNTPLFIDVGNSQIKWQWGLTSTKIKYCLISDFSPQCELYQAIAHANGCFICCVPHHPYFPLIKKHLSPFAIYWVKEVPQTPAFHIAYQNFQTFGIDRYLSLLAVYESAPVIVVDCGSAITIDMMSDSRTHLGGWILPGISTSKKQLGQYGLPISEDIGICDNLGKDTGSAITNGYHSMVIAFLEKLTNHPHRYGLISPKLILTGGDAKPLKNDLSYHWQYLPNLVLTGLVKYQQSLHLREYSSSNFKH